MRVLLINQYYLPDTAATGQLLADVAEALVARGHDVEVLCSRRLYGGRNASHPPRETIAGVAIRRVWATGFGRRILAGRLADYLSFYLTSLLAALFGRRSDVCVTLTTPPFISMVGAILALLRRTRFVFWRMDVYPEVAVVYGAIRHGSLLHRILRSVAAFSCGRASVIVSLSEGMTRRTIEAGVPATRIRTVPNWVPGERVRPLDSADSVRWRRWNPDGRMALMYSGNLGLGHELESVVEALRELGPEAPVRALFVGDGKMRQPLEKRVRELGLERSIAFHPPQPLDGLCDSLAAGDVHLVSQRPGTQGLIVPSKLYGVLAAGRAILYIGPEDTHVAQVVRDSGAGVRVANGDVAALAEALRGLAADPAGRAEMGRRGRLYYEGHFGRDRSVARIVAAIEDRPDPVTSPVRP